MQPITINVQISLAENAAMPEYATEGAVGVDLRCSEAVSLAPLERKLAPTGLRVAIPPGFEGQVRPRSGLALKKGIGIVNAPGTIDSDYRGEIGVILINLSNENVTLDKGERIAQLVFCPVARAGFEVVEREDLMETTRGEG